MPTYSQPYSIESDSTEKLNSATFFVDKLDTYLQETMQNVKKFIQILIRLALV